ncbi:hypothetical protein RchiOBHm_Chr2g0127671 [Rosa chinensis]|uniref:Uncharacterized protein n=1 Tax=Rosa chinensis TaxID=74649 RepID=A0A2P6RU73_ROSCH|nr:hypothetical protein RchiOBHm_Chr2g0127671 [Rosa chinensis]
MNSKNQNEYTTGTIDQFVIILLPSSNHITASQYKVQCLYCLPIDHKKCTFL